MVRTMKLDDYEDVKQLWLGIKGFAIRSIDDSKEGIIRFLKRNPTTSVVAVSALQEEGINIVNLIAFTKNDVGNAFWKQLGWRKREDLNYYDFILDMSNEINFVK